MGKKCCYVIDYSSAVGSLFKA